MIHADRLRLEEAFAADPARLSPQERRFLLQEPFHLLAPKAAERFRSSHFDLRTLLAVGGGVVLLVLAGALGKAAPAAADAAIAVAFLAAIALVAWQVAQIKHRWFREVIFPTLVPALRPLQPSPQEIEDILRELKGRGERIGKKLDPRRLLAALAEDAATQAAAAAAAAKTTILPADLLPRAPAAPPPRAAMPPAPPPAAPSVAPPSPSAAEIPPASSAPAKVRAPGLKLKYGGIRHRVTAADGEILIGRAPDANIVVSEQHVSRHHASIIWDDFGYPLLVNLSQIGTSVQVDGEPAPERVETSIRLRGQGSIGLSGEFAFAEEHRILVAYEVKGGTPAA